jgi:parallel beta-helix repeat protein
VAGEPAAFMSYVRSDDTHDGGQLSKFREQLAGEVKMQTGREFTIFQDRNDVKWGQSWKARIIETLDAVTLLLVIVTPGLFQSPQCRDEVTRFRERERTLGRADLILPVYYVSAREVDNLDLRRKDELATLLWSREYADWRDLRFEVETSLVVRKTIAQLASQVRDIVWGDLPPLPVLDTSVQGPESGSTAHGDDPAAGSVHPKNAAKTSLPEYVVDPYPQRGDFTSVGQAIAAAEPGSTILVHPGLYEETLLVDKPLDIVGDGAKEDIEILGKNGHVLEFRTNIGLVTNLKLSQADGAGSYGVMIQQGRLNLEGCDISSRGGSCVYIEDGASPRIRHNTIHAGRENGVVVRNGGLGTLEDNEITGNALAAVAIETGGDPVLRRNKIHHGKDSGVAISERGLGTLEDNEIAGNADVGVTIQTGGNPVLRRNQIRGNQRGGLHVDGGGLGTLENNAITGNAATGVEITGDSQPTLRGNRITGNAYAGVWIHDGGKGAVEDNDLTGNGRGAWDIEPGCEPNVTRSRNAE